MPARGLVGHIKSIEVKLSAVAQIQNTPSLGIVKISRAEVAGNNLHRELLAEKY